MSDIIIVLGAVALIFVAGLTFASIMTCCISGFMRGLQVILRRKSALNIKV